MTKAGTIFESRRKSKPFHAYNDVGSPHPFAAKRPILAGLNCRINDGSSFCGAQVVAVDFFNVVTVSFRVLYVFVIMEIGTCKMLHFNVTAHPTAEWTLQQFREAIGCEHDYRFVIADRDDKFSADIRRSVRGMGVRPLRTPRRAPQANAYCERLIGTTRRECLDFLIPLSEEHLRRLLTKWREYYNRARPHSSLGPCLPTPCVELPMKPGPAPTSITRPARRCLEAGPWWAPSRLPVVTRRLTELASRGE